MKIDLENISDIDFESDVEDEINEILEREREVCLNYEERIQLGLKMVPSVSFPTDKQNFYIVHTDRLDVAYSYETPIGFRITAPVGGPWIVRENDFSATTARHLKWLDGGINDRVAGYKFLPLLGEVL